MTGRLPEEGIWRVWQGRRNHQPDFHGDDPEEHGGGRHQGEVLVEIAIIISSYVYCNCSPTWRTTQLRWMRRTPANSTSPCFVRSSWIFNGTVARGRKLLKIIQTKYTPPSPVQVAAKFLIEDDEEQMKEELKEAFRIYDKEGQGFITTDVLKVERPSRAGNKPSRSFVASSISDTQIIGQY